MRGAAFASSSSRLLHLHAAPPSLLSAARQLISHANLAAQNIDKSFGGAENYLTRLHLALCVPALWQKQVSLLSLFLARVCAALVCQFPLVFGPTRRIHKQHQRGAANKTNVRRKSKKGRNLSL